MGNNNKGLEKSVELLRHRFINTNEWDYCIAWNLTLTLTLTQTHHPNNNHPSRFIEWVGCCCNGGADTENHNPNYFNTIKIENRDHEEGDDNDNDNDNEEDNTTYNNASSCRDVNNKHLVKSKACQALAKLPSRLPFNSAGIRGQVVMSNQPKWLIHSTCSYDSTGTQVLIPVLAGGLIELFTSKRILKDQLIIDSVKGYCDAAFEQAMTSPQISTNTSHDLQQQLLPEYQQMMDLVNLSFEQQLLDSQDFCNVSLNEHNTDPLLENSLLNFETSFPFLHLMQAPIQVSQLNALRSFEGSSSSSNIFNENSQFDSSYFGYICSNGQWEQSIGRSPVTKSSKQVGNASKQLPAGLGKVKKDQGKAIRKPAKSPSLSKNLISERNRRNRIKDGLYALRALVPNITKMDKIAIIGDAIDYIGYLKNECERLGNELKDIEEEDCYGNIANLNYPKPDWPGIGNSSKERNKSSLNADGKEKTELQVEVNQIGERGFLIKILCKKKCGGFSKLMEGLNLMELQVHDVNVTTLNGLVLNVLTVEANTDIKLKKLRDLLLELER
ncbi:hypothetical protein ACFE04_023726 [Oxalis oulophora]